MPEYRFVGSHVEDLDDGRILEPDATVELAADQQQEPKAALLLAEGKLLALPDQKKTDRKESD